MLVQFQPFINKRLYETNIVPMDVAIEHYPEAISSEIPECVNTGTALS